jgi:2-oxoglutarate ferredoxin oxidoreductase subunit delta
VREERTDDVTRGPTVVLDQDLCKGCGLCIDVCPPGVLRQDARLNHLGFHPVAYLGRWCNACGLCFFACPEPGAIIVIKPSRAHGQEVV